jgi:hypothetical protein
VPGGIEPGTFHAALISVFCSTFIISRGGGTRTHTPSQDPDFKCGVVCLSLFLVVQKSP